MSSEARHANGNGSARMEKREAVATAQLLREIGVQSNNRSFDGRTYDPFITSLSGTQAIRTYSEMSTNDPTIGRSCSPSTH